MNICTFVFSVFRSQHIVCGLVQSERAVWRGAGETYGKKHVQCQLLYSWTRRIHIAGYVGRESHTRQSIRGGSAFKVLNSNSNSYHFVQFYAHKIKQWQKQTNKSKQIRAESFSTKREIKQNDTNISHIQSFSPNLIQFEKWPQFEKNSLQQDAWICGMSACIKFMLWINQSPIRKYAPFDSQPKHIYPSLQFAIAFPYKLSIQQTDFSLVSRNSQVNWSWLFFKVVIILFHSTRIEFRSTVFS